ncbi:hypothetical protein FRB99_008990 [Tulasnella sp. 403]|nr:hypothetical protein FRB99_008990 [Tulasnella sp. 403]
MPITTPPYSQDPSRASSPNSPRSSMTIRPLVPILLSRRSSQNSISTAHSNGSGPDVRQRGKLHHPPSINPTSVTAAVMGTVPALIAAPPLSGRPTRRPVRRKQTTLWNFSDWSGMSGDDEPFEYPNPTLVPHFGRRQASAIAMSAVIGTEIFIGSGDALVDAGPVGAFLGYVAMSSVVYGMVVSSSEMVAVYPNCRGTVGLAGRFVDPALGFAMGWNAWYHWGITIPSQISAATALVEYWRPPARLAALWPPVFIILTSGSVFGARIYGEVENVFALFKISAVALLVILSIVLGAENASQRGESPFRFWKEPFAQYLGIDGGLGRFLGVLAVFMQAATSFLGTEIPSLISGEIIDAPNVIAPISRRVWIRVSIMYAVLIFAAGTLVSPAALAKHPINPNDPRSPEDDAPWHASPFLVAFAQAGKRYDWVTNVCVVMFIASAASAASSVVFISSRYLYWLAKAGHAPRFLGAIYPDTDEAKANGAVVPVWGVATTLGFATLSFMCMRPSVNTMSNVEKVYKWISAMSGSACLLAWIGTLFTYIRFWKGTRNPLNKGKYPREIARILEVRAWGQPFWAIYSFFVCSLILVFNGWSLFNSKVGKWVIYHSNDQGIYQRDQVLKFLTTYLPIPVLMLLIFWYKLINQTTMRRSFDMDFSGVAFPDPTPREQKPTGFWRRVWWFLVY